MSKQSKTILKVSGAAFAVTAAASVAPMKITMLVHRRRNCLLFLAQITA